MSVKGIVDEPTRKASITGFPASLRDEALIDSVLKFSHELAHLPIANPKARTASTCVSASL